MGAKYKIIPIIVITFLAVFCPPFIPFNSLYILAFIAILDWLLNKKYTILLADPLLLNLIVFFDSYILLVILINFVKDANSDLLMNRITVLYQLFVLIPFQFMTANYIVDVIRKKNNSITIFWNVFIISGLIEVACVCVSFLIPSVREIFLKSILSHGGIPRIYANSEALIYRGYGWADTLLDTFGYGMGIYAGICLLNKKLGKKRFLFMLLFVFATLVNSRTGIAIFMVAVIVLIFNSIKKCDILQFLKTFLLAIFIITFGIAIINSSLIDAVTKSWIISGFRSVWNLFTGKKENYHLGSMQNSLLSKKFWILPDSFMGILFGRGHSVFGTKDIIGSSSDVGYVNYIWIGGLVGTIFLLIIIYRWFDMTRKLSIDDIEYEIITFLLLSFYVMFIKGNIITHTSGTFLTILIITYFRKTKYSALNTK